MSLVHFESGKTLRSRARWRLLRLSVAAFAMAAIFLVDTLTHYEVAVAVFYSLIMLAAAAELTRRQLMRLCLVCIALTLLSFVLSTSGAMRAGLINSVISLAAIGATTWLALKRAAAEHAAHAAQAQLLRLARIQNLEGLTSSIAHEINQPLAAIVTSAHAARRWLEQTPAQSDKARQTLERIVRDASRASAVIARVRRLTRGEAVTPQVFDLHAALHDVLALAQGELQRAGIVLHLDLAATPARVLADRVQIQQVIGNLLLNAVQAMQTVDVARRRLVIATQHLDAAVQLTLRDTGPGVSADAAAHVFDAFWTTKTDGIGIGLSLARGIVEAHGGRIWVQRAPEGGAMFAFTVPLASAHPPNVGTGYEPVHTPG